MTGKISEIFQSVQGEGKYVGVRQVFIRFFGCQLDCTWCDTSYARDPSKGRFEEMASDDVIAQAEKMWHGCHSVSLTGGEPLLQADFIQELLPRFKKARLAVYLDTNAVEHAQLLKIMDGIDIIAADIKLPSSTRGPALWDRHAAFLSAARDKDLFVKAVITPGTAVEDLRQAARLISGIDADIPVFLQPESGSCNRALLEQCLSFQKICLESLKDVRIVPQMHKWLGIR